jgi:hypothetical protein
MHVLLLADGRSPIARRMLDTILSLGHRVTLVSSFQCPQPPGVEELIVLPVAFSRFVTGSSRPASTPGAAGKSKRISAFRQALLFARYRLGPLSVQGYAGRYRKVLRRVQPDLVHALRIPYEGMLASFTPSNIPLAISIWGNDLTLHAGRSAGMTHLTRRTLARADGLHTDAARDLSLAMQWGFSADTPHLVVLERRPETVFVCPNMQGESQAQRWVERLGLDERVVLLPGLPQEQLWGLFSRSPISVSVTTHDGTPNTLLEAMACGSFPIAGDLESLREWITPGRNGLLVETGKPQSLAEAILQGLDSPELRSQAAESNLKLILERAEVSQVRPQMEVFYQWVWGLR